MDANIKNLRDALEWLDRSIREEAELDGEMTATHASQLGFIQSMLEKFPLRNCDVGTAREQADRYREVELKRIAHLTRCPHAGFSAFFPKALDWANMPYEAAQEGGDHAVS